jgi:hypothetical protein
MNNMDPQLVEAHKAYEKAFKELNKEKFHESYTKYSMTNKKKIVPDQVQIQCQSVFIGSPS